MVTGGNLKSKTISPKYFKKPFTIYTPKETTTKDGNKKIDYSNKETNYQLIAYAGDVGIINHIKYGFKAPDKIREDSFETYLHLDFLPALEDHLRTLRLYPREDGEQLDISLLIIYMNKIYEIFPDFTCMSYDENYHVIGAGNEIALGSLYSTIGEDPEYRVKIAIHACNHHTNCCSDKMDLITLTLDDYKEKIGKED
jgi:hypothetical protein